MNFHPLEALLRITGMTGYLFYLVDRDLRQGIFTDCVHSYFSMMRFSSTSLWPLDVSLGPQVKRSRKT